MAATKYTFTIATDFPNHKVSSDRLTQEIELSAIVTALDHIDTTEEVCDVWFKAPLSGGDVTVLDALVAAHSGEPLAPPQPVDPHGAPYVSLLLGQPGLKLTIKGLTFEAPANQTTDHDEVFSENREIQGSWFEVVNHKPGDYVELFVCLPDGTPVAQFGETVFVPPDGAIDQVVSEGADTLPAGLKLRLRYVAVDSGETRVVYAYYRMRK